MEFEIQPVWRLLIHFASGPEAVGADSAARLIAARLTLCTALRARTKASFVSGPAASRPAMNCAISDATLAGRDPTRWQGVHTEVEPVSIAAVAGSVS